MVISIDLMNQIEIRPANKEQQPILANLLELCAHDFSETWLFDIGDDGFYGYEYLPLYWQEANRFPFLIYVFGKIAGLVLVQQGSALDNDPQIWDIAEFFILRKYRKQGIGTWVVHKVWQQFKDRWQVRVLQKNVIARAFWVQAIEQFTGNEVAIVTITDKDNYNWDIFKFES